MIIIIDNVSSSGWVMSSSTSECGDDGCSGCCDGISSSISSGGSDVPIVGFLLY